MIIIQPYRETIIDSSSLFPVDIFLQDNLQRNITVDPHWHECVEILYMLEGTALQQINDRRFSMQKNDMVILHEGIVHSTYCTVEEDVKILVVKFLPGIINKNYPRAFESKYFLAFFNAYENQTCHITDMPQHAMQIHHLMLGLYDEFRNREAGYEIYTVGYIYQLIACLVRANFLNIPDTLKLREDIHHIDRIFRYVEKHYKDRISIKDASGMLNLSCSYFSKYFKKITGRTFKEYVDYVRICEVEKLILSGAMNVSQAAYEAGFSNIPSFNRVFKRVRGYVPGILKGQKLQRNE